MSNKAWSGLNDDEKKMFEEVFAAEAEFIDQMVISKEDELLNMLKDKGMKVIEVDRQPFMDRVPLVLEKYPDFKDLYDKIQAIK